MPIGVPRILYSWSEELPAQWTDIYNYIFRRRMIFLMQYLDDDLCNQICGLLINIHMEDRSKDLEKKELEKSNAFKSSTKSSTSSSTAKSTQGSQASSLAAGGSKKSIQDLLTSEEDLMIDENYKLEQYTLQKITLDWLNWTANYFDYSNEPYLFYLTEILAKDFITENSNLLYNYKSNTVSGKLEKYKTKMLKVPKFLQQNRINIETDIMNNNFSETSDKKYLGGNSTSCLANLAFNTSAIPSSIYGVPSLPFREGNHYVEGEGEGLQGAADKNSKQQSLPLTNNKMWISSELSKFMGIFKAMVDSSLLGKKLKNKKHFVKEVEKVNSGKNTNLFDFWTPPSTSLLSTEAIDYFLYTEERKPKITLPPIPRPGDRGRYISYAGDQNEFIFSQSLVNIEKENPLDKASLGKKFISIFEKFNSPEIVYSPFRYFAPLNAEYYNFSLFKNILQPEGIKSSSYNNKNNLGLNIIKQIDRLKKVEKTGPLLNSLNPAQTVEADVGKNVLFNELTNKKYFLKTQTHKTVLESSKQALSQRLLKNQYRKDKTKFVLTKDISNQNIHNTKGKEKDYSTTLSEAQKRNRFKIKNGKTYLNPASFSSLITDPLRSESVYGLKGKGTTLQGKNQNFEKTFSYRKQAEKAIEEEELKKVFVIINSFGGSVGNGITVHDALQFIKAGSLTLALGVAASAASLVLAGGTIGERYVTEGCHTMIHQPEGSINGQASDILIDSNEIMKIRLDVAEIYSLSTYRPRHKILRDLDRDFYLTAAETVSYGLADEIATNDVLSEIIDMTNKVWDYHEGQQQRLLESRERAASGLDTQTQN